MLEMAFVTSVTVSQSSSISPTPAPGAPGDQSPGQNAVFINLTIENNAFSENTLYVPAGARVTIPGDRLFAAGI
jgi:hypothetical protein